MPDDQRARLDQCLDEFIPPSDAEEARSLATVGEPVLARLPENLEEISSDEAAATIQTTWMINGPKAIEILRRYADTQHRFVQNELGYAWDYFDPDEYYQHVLTAMLPAGILYSNSSPAHLALVAKTPPLSELDVFGLRQADLSFLDAHAATLRELSLFYSGSDIADLTVLPELPKLRNLSLGVPGLTNLTFLDSLPPLESAWLNFCDVIDDYSPLQRSTELTLLGLFQAKRLRSLLQLPSLGSLDGLWLSGCRFDGDWLRKLAREAPKLRQVSLEDCNVPRQLDPLSVPKLWYLDISKNRSVSDLRPLAGQAGLIYLNISHTNVESVEPLKDIASLGKLYIEGIESEIDLSPLAGNANLTVYIAPGQGVRGGEKLGNRLRTSR